MTNGDRIRQMTDKELAEFFCQISQCCGNDASCSMCPIYDGCAQNVMCVERWLREEVFKMRNMVFTLDDCEASDNEICETWNRREKE